MWMLCSFNRWNNGISAFACNVGSPPLKVTPPFLPKKAFWLTAIRTISSIVVSVLSPLVSIVSGLAQ
jgi:hypothetical protein